MVSIKDRGENIYLKVYENFEGFVNFLSPSFIISSDVLLKLSELKV